LNFRTVFGPEPTQLASGGEIHPSKYLSGLHCFVAKISKQVSNACVRR
jgi:hypothetical protein